MPDFQMPPISAERHVEQFRRLLLRGRGLEVGVVHRPIELGIPRETLAVSRPVDLHDRLQGGDALARIGSAPRPIDHQSRSSQRVGHQQIGLREIAQGIAHRCRKFRLAQNDQRRRRRAAAWLPGEAATSRSAKIPARPAAVRCANRARTPHRICHRLCKSASVSARSDRHRRTRPPTSPDRRTART